MKVARTVRRGKPGACERPALPYLNFAKLWSKLKVALHNVHQGIQSIIFSKELTKIEIVYVVFTLYKLLRF